MKRGFAIIVSLLLILAILASCDNTAADKAESNTEKSDVPSDTPNELQIQATEAPQYYESEMFGTYFRPNDDLSPIAFTITVNPNGTYHYYETAISSHMGLGKYTIDDNIITLIDDNIPTLTGAKTYYFKFEYRDGKLIFLASESDKFMYVNLPDGAVFERASQAEN